jgi:hypothetical protein
VTVIATIVHINRTAAYISYYRLLLEKQRSRDLMHLRQPTSRNHGGTCIYLGVEDSARRAGDHLLDVAVVEHDAEEVAGGHMAALFASSSVYAEESRVRSKPIQTASPRNELRIVN